MKRRIYLDSLGLKRIIPKGRNYPFSSLSMGKNATLMSEKNGHAGLN